MNVCFVASEVVPYAKTGGLADVSGALPKYLARYGCDVRVFLPLYNMVDTRKYDLRPVDSMQRIGLQFGGRWIHFSVWGGTLPDSNARVFLIDCPELYHRGSVYTDSADEYLRFALLSKAAIECCQRMGFAPDIMHCNDWQTGLIPLMLKTIYSWDRLFSRTRTVLTLHNVAYQGVFSASTIDVVGMGEYRQRFDNDDLRYGIVNWMKTGIFYADAITTVSKTYAQEIRTAEGGAGLDRFLRQRGGAVMGIVNGVDYNEWSPEKDAFTKYKYSINDLSGKEANKQHLLQRVNLTYDPAAPVLGIVSRLTDQKGFDLMFDTIDQVLSRRNIRLVVLGSGDDRYERFFSGVQTRHPGKVCYYKGYSNELAHLIEAGADIFLMPSRFEPCGLNQIYSLRYGTVPVVRKTGGLADTVQQFDPTTGNGTGFVFRRFSPKELYWAIEFAIHTWHNRPVWRQIMRNGMRKNYSWEAQVQQYLRLYLRLTS